MIDLALLFPDDVAPPTPTRSTVSLDPVSPTPDTLDAVLAAVEDLRLHWLEDRGKCGVLDMVANVARQHSRHGDPILNDMVAYVATLSSRWATPYRGMNFAPHKRVNPP